MNTKTVNVLLAEDNAADAELVRECLAGENTPVQLSLVKDGEAALKFLKRKGSYTAAPRPQLVILDLNLPKSDAHEILTEIKTEESLKSIPVIVLTTSDAPSDIKKTYELYANCYVTKPLRLNDFVNTLNLIRTFWLNTAKLP